MKAKDIALIGLLSATITSGKLALSFIPNVEIVTLLFIIYAVTFGYKRTFLVSIVFTTTEIFIYGFSTWILVYYFIWNMLILITVLVNKRVENEYAFGIIAGVFGLFFGLFFALSESIFYGIAYGITYWIKGIPFDIIHGISNFILVLLLFKPLSLVVAKQSRRFM